MRALTLAVAATAVVARSALAQPAAPAPPPATAPTDPAASPSRPIDPARLATSYLQQEIAALAGGRTQADRDDAARRLIARQSAAGRQELLQALAAPPPAALPSAPLAAARAIAGEPQPSPEFVRPLAALLGTDRAHSEAAAAALIAIRDAAALDALRRFIANPDPPDVAVPRTVIRVLASSADKVIAEALVELVTNPRANKLIVSAAADALVDMTQLPEHGRDPEAWRRWWFGTRAGPAAPAVPGAQAKPPDAFRADLLDMRRRRLPGAGMEQIDPLLSRLFQLTEPRAQPEFIRQVLESGDPRSRMSGVRLVYDSFSLTGRMLDNTPQKLRDMIRDPSPDVRLEVARTLQALNDRQSLEPLLAQLSIEPNAAVRVAIMSALVEIRDPRAVPALIGLTNDPSMRVAVAATESLAKLGGVIRTEQALSARVSAALVQAIRNRAQQPANDELRAASVEALVPLRDPRHQQLFLSLYPNQGVRTRVAAIQGLGEIGDPASGNTIINWLRGEQDALVRLAALGALRTVGTFQLDVAIFEHTKPQVEPDASNRKAAWDTFVALMPGAGQQQLSDWAQRFFANGEFDRRIPVLQEILKKQQAANDPAAAAITQEQIGESYMNLQPPRPQAAVPYYREALQYWLANGGNPQNVAAQTRSLLKAQIAAKLYADAITLAREAINRDRTQQGDVMGMIATAAERLNETAQPREAERLATEALGLRDIIEPRFVERLTAAQARARQTP